MEEAFNYVTMINVVCTSPPPILSLAQYMQAYNTLSVRTPVLLEMEIKL